MDSDYSQNITECYAALLQYATLVATQYVCPSTYHMPALTLEKVPESQKFIDMSPLSHCHPRTSFRLKDPRSRL